MLDRNVLVAADKWLCQQGWNDSDAEPGSPAFVPGGTAWSAPRDARFDARMVVQDVGGWDSYVSGMREQKIDLPVA
jgi:hypothetical protein